MNKIKDVIDLETNDRDPHGLFEYLGTWDWVDIDTLKTDEGMNKYFKKPMLLTSEKSKKNELR